MSELNETNLPLKENLPGLERLYAADREAIKHSCIAIGGGMRDLLDWLNAYAGDGRPLTIGLVRAWLVDHFHGNTASCQALRYIVENAIAPDRKKDEDA